MSIAYKNAAEKLRLKGLDKKVKETYCPKSILLFLAERANESGYCFPGVAYIADALEMAEPTVRKWTAWLEKYDFIEKSRRGKGNGYQLLFAPHPRKKKNDEEYPTDDEKPSPSDDKNTAILERSEENSPLYYSGEWNQHRYNIEPTPLYYIAAILCRLIITNKERESSQESIKPSAGKKANFSEFCENAKRGIRSALGVIHLPFTETRWRKAFETSFENGFTAEEFVECFREKSLDPKRNHPVTPENTASELPHFRLRSTRPPTDKRTFDNGQNFSSVTTPTAVEIPSDQWLENEYKRLALHWETGRTAFVREELEFFALPEQEYLREKIGITEAA